MLFKNNVAFFIIIPIISTIPAFIFHQQSFEYSFLAIRTIIYWLLYFLLHYYNINEKKIIRLIVFVGICMGVFDNNPTINLSLLYFLYLGE